MSDTWYAVSTQPHKEFFARQHLENQGFRVFLPATLRAVRHARKVEHRWVAYFPGYLFVAKDDGHWRSINGTRGVRRLIAAGEGPAIVPAGLVEELQSRTNADGALHYTGVLAPGDKVRVEQGPFADFVGVIHSLKDTDRVRVLLDLMSSSTPVELAREHCMPVGEH